MKNLYRKLKFTAAIGSLAFAMWLAVFHTSIFFYSVLGCIVVSIVVFACWRSHRTHRFSKQRAAAMNAVEDLSKMLAYYDAELPLNVNSRRAFQTVVDNADKIGAALRSWIYLMHDHFQRNCLPKKGLQMKDVPELLNGVRNEIIEAYSFVRDGNKGIRTAIPAILRDDWFDEATTFGESIMRISSGPGMPGSDRRARREFAKLHLVPSPSTLSTARATVAVAAARPVIEEKPATLAPAIPVPVLDAPSGYRHLNPSPRSAVVVVLAERRARG